MGASSADFNEKCTVKDGIRGYDFTADGDPGDIFHILALDLSRNVGYGFKCTKGPVRMVRRSVKCRNIDTGDFTGKGF